ncbi:MAG: hypothetical protein AAF357_06940 [Verrucomicrobiota bacterium]
MVICGLVAAWTIKKVINDRGGLHNRVTRTIRLLPFSLGESTEFLKERGLNLDHRQLIQIYMTIGGVPLYLRENRTRPVCSAKRGTDLFHAKWAALGRGQQALQLPVFAIRPPRRDCRGLG